MNYLRTNEMNTATLTRAKKVIDTAALFIGIGLITGIVITLVLVIIDSPLIIA